MNIVKIEIASPLSADRNDISVRGEVMIETDNKIVGKVKKGKKINRKLECEGLECYRVMQYQDKLFAEEATGE